MTSMVLVDSTLKSLTTSVNAPLFSESKHLKYLPFKLGMLIAEPYFFPNLSRKLQCNLRGRTPPMQLHTKSLEGGGHFVGMELGLSI